MKDSIDYGRPHTLKEIAEILGISRECVRQIEKRAFEKIRKRLKTAYGVTCVADMI